MKPREFIHKVTGEVVTQIPLLEMREYEEYFGTCQNCGTSIDKEGRCGHTGD